MDDSINQIHGRDQAVQEATMTDSFWDKKPPKELPPFHPHEPGIIETVVDTVVDVVNAINPFHHKESL